MKLETHRSFPSELQSLVAAANARLSASHAVERLWARDHQLWKQDSTDITNRLGWLTIIDYMKDRTEELRTLGTLAKKRGIRDVVLLGMGGSSLGPEVLRASFGPSSSFPRLWVLDSTVPGWIRQVTRAIDPARSLFILASKSGGTIEVMSLFAHFWELVHQTKGHQSGEQFLAITDPGTGLEKLAAEHQFWRIFTNPPDIGGRYSVLSYFGLVPAALMGIDVTRLLTRATAMAQACRIQPPLGQNPGADLAATMASLAQAGRNKVTLIASPQIATFGLWAEQLLAESTGKEGKGLIPVASEPLVSPTAYGTDRLFVYLRLMGDRNRQLDRHIAGLARQGHPVLTFTLQDRYDLAAEFFRWEVATALAGHLLGIHPFDQPNVQESKDNTARVLETIQSTGRLPKQTRATVAQAAAQLKRHNRPGAYVAILAYATPSSKMEQAIRSLRRALVSHHHVTTTAGYGPRYLHSTGQLHKGGPKSGLFLQLVDPMIPDLNIPGKPFTFRTLAQAQAAGDIQALHAHDQQAILLSLGKNPVATIQALTKSLAPRTPARRPTIRRTRGRRPRKE
ncbi:MAG: glucose-6-phosphate isomerase [Nitrospiraceae bacterium]|nr:glucose-6-phosphate isomerase [Nitrospiraceae bacterium]